MRVAFPLVHWSGRRHVPSSVTGNRSIRPATECPAAVCLETGGRRGLVFQGPRAATRNRGERPGSGPRPSPRPRGCPISSRSRDMTRRSPSRARGRPPRVRAPARRDLDQHVERVARPRRRISRGPLAPFVGWRAPRGAPELAQPAGMVSARQALRRTSTDMARRRYAAGRRDTGRDSRRGSNVVQRGAARREGVYRPAPSPL